MLISKQALVLGAAVLGCAMIGSTANAAWSCAKCHGTTTPQFKPSAARLDQVSTYSEWEGTPTKTAGTRYLAQYTYATGCQQTANQFVATYPEDAARRDYIYMYNPKTGKHWARCQAQRAPGEKAEWQIFVEGKGWEEEGKKEIRIPVANRKVIDPPLPPL